MTPGRKSGIKKKIDGNEDALAALTINHQIELLLLADSHYGAMPANFAIDHFAELFRAVRGSNPRRLFFTHLMLDVAIREAKGSKWETLLGSSTTLISVALKGDAAAYCSTGDSLFFVLRGGQMKEICEPHESLFLGDAQKHIFRFVHRLEKMGAIDAMSTDEQVRDTLFQLTKIYKQVKAGRFDLPSVKQILASISYNLGIPFPVEAEEIATEWSPLNEEMRKHLPVWGSFTLKKDDVLFLATDGIDQESSDCPIEDVQKILEDPSLDLAQQAETILGRCLGKKGGNDNISIVIVRV